MEPTAADLQMTWPKPVKLEVPKRKTVERYRPDGSLFESISIPHHSNPAAIVWGIEACEKVFVKGKGGRYVQLENCIHYYGN